jgi:hypothetical protein
MASGSSFSGGSSSSYLRTDGIGKVKVNTVGSVTVPIGFNPFLPVTITNGQGVDYTISVNDGVTDFNGTPVTSHAVNKTWKITASTTVANVTVKLAWDASLAELTDFDESQSYVAFRTTNGTGPWISGTAGAATDEGAGIFSQVITMSTMDGGNP